MNFTFVVIFVAFTLKQIEYQLDYIDENNDVIKPISYAIVPKLFAGFVLIGSIISIRLSISKHAQGRYSVREVLIIVHTLLFFLSILCQIVYFALEKSLQNIDESLDDGEITKIFATLLLFSGLCKLFNLLIIFIFFYMAV